jgi:hypothetical protein
LKWLRKKRKKVANAAANAAVSDKDLWSKYFHDIRQVCPWSYSAWKRNKIEIVLWCGMAEELNGLEARVHILINAKPRLLKKIEQRLNDEKEFEEWLHSHPSYGINSTPVPVLIQQDRIGLENARKNHSITVKPAFN